MKVGIFTLCDAATVDSSNRLNILGTFDRIYAKQTPIIYPLCALAVKLRFEKILFANIFWCGLPKLFWNCIMSWVLVYPLLFGNTSGLYWCIDNSREVLVLNCRPVIISGSIASISFYLSCISSLLLRWYDLIVEAGYPVSLLIL